MKFILLSLAALLILCVPLTAKGDKMNRAEWMAEGHYGIMTHWFLYPDLVLPDATQEEKTRWFNEQVDNFDLDTLMKQFDSTGASWLIFTCVQCNGYWNSPNAFVDRVLPGHTPKRDLMVEVAKAVHKRGKRFIFYLPGQPYSFNQFCPGAGDAFCWKDGEDNSENREFEDCMIEMFEDYSKKMGKLCDGWWIDGCYHERHKEKWHWEEWCRAMRKGNPDAAVALSDGSFCIGLLKPLYAGCDYFGGETHVIEDGMIRIDSTVAPKEDYGEGKRFYLDAKGHIRQKGKRPEFFVPASQFIAGQQLHSLMSFDGQWSEMPVEWNSYSPEELAKFVNAMAAVKGAVTINIPNTGSGALQQSSVDKVVAMRRLLNFK